MAKATRWSAVFVCLVLGGAMGSFIASPYFQGRIPVVAAAPQAPDAPAVPAEPTSYRDVVKKVLPAVVSIEFKTRPKPRADRDPARPRPRIEGGPEVPDEFRSFFEEIQRRPLEDPADFPSEGFGSGVIVDPKGVVLTNYHVVSAADQVEVKLHDGRKFLSKEIRFDRKTDIAIVLIEGKEPFPALELGDSQRMEIGDRVLAVGAPFGLTGSVTHGIISAKGRNGLKMNMYEDFLQTDAAINPGNSGGPLVNLSGQVIGINAAIKSRSGGFQGVGLAIASNIARNVVPQLVKDGIVRRGYLGIQIKDLEPAVADRLGLGQATGVLVSVVFEGSPAAKAGFQAGDVVTAIADQPVKNGQDLQRIVAGLPLGKEANVTIFRDGKGQALKVIIAEQPDDIGATRIPLPRIPQRNQTTIRLEKLGLELMDMNADLASQLGFKESATGALVAHVEPDGLAAEAGLRRGMLITRVDKQAIDAATSGRDAIEKAALEKGILLQVQSPQGGTGYVVVKGDSSK